jgi:hypothetical protein
VGGNHRVFRRYVDEIWCIPTDHFDPAEARLAGFRRIYPAGLADVLVEGSTYSRKALKRRLYEAGIKARCCELCGQGEEWRGSRMSLILDHINGVPDDNRLENLRIVCPNCAATLDTHCGRNIPRRRTCPACGEAFAPKDMRQRYCSLRCWGKVAAHSYRGNPHPKARKVPRPSYDELKADLETMSYLAVGRKYGVSDNAIRKWLRWYEREREAEARDQAPRESHTSPPDTIAA